MRACVRDIVNVFVVLKMTSVINCCMIISPLG